MRVNPEVLRWARTTARLDLANAAARLGFRDRRNSTAEERLAELENALVEPSREILLRMTTVYRRPLLTFYLQEPPIQASSGEDFRTLPDQQRNASAATVGALVRDICARQGEVRGLLEEEGATLITAVAASRREEGAAVVAGHIVDWLQFDLAAFRLERTVEAAFSHLRAAAERAGVFVLLVGDLGSDPSAIDAVAFRGFALADPIAPFIVINDQDAEGALAFTLVHELAHVAIGASGLSGGTPEGLVEAFCNDVAGEILLPRSELELFPVPMDDVALRQSITEFAIQRKVSRQTVAYRLRIIGHLDHLRWRDISRGFQADFTPEHDKHRATERGGDETSYYEVRRHRLGTALLPLVRRNLDEGKLTPTRAGKILGVKARSVEPLLAGAAL
jgi:Zn-dependent peptidase ImmA (M78 family)